MAKSKEDQLLEELGYPTIPMKLDVSIATIRTKVRAIAKLVPDHKAMYTKYMEGKSKHSSKKEKPQYELGCNKLKEWLKGKSLKDGTSIAIDFTEPAGE